LTIRHVLNVLSYNIERGGTGRERLLASVIADEAPDIVVLQEATRPEVVARLARATGMSASGAVAGRSLGFLSRIEIARHSWVRPRWSQHAFLEVVPAGMNLRIVGVHLSAVHAAWTEVRRVRELRSLLAAIACEGQDQPLVVGDFNTVAPDERFDIARLPRRLQLLVWLSGGRIRWQTIAIMLGADYVDGYRQLHAAEPGYTFPTWDPHVRLDYVFVPKEHASRLTACDVISTGPSVRSASDHFPIRVRIDVDQ
jgi:endonuclease/exonuclease/phosphatase family metal-dependent hydrolase